jgi:hypothetical protein
MGSEWQFTMAGRMVNGEMTMRMKREICFFLVLETGLSSKV